MTFPEIKTYRVSGELLIIFPRHLQGNAGKNTVIEDVRDGVDELPYSDFSKSAASVFDKIDNGNAIFLP